MRLLRFPKTHLCFEISCLLPMTKGRADRQARLETAEGTDCRYGSISTCGKAKSVNTIYWRDCHLPSLFGPGEHQGIENVENDPKPTEEIYMPTRQLDPANALSNHHPHLPTASSFPTGNPLVVRFTTSFPPPTTSSCSTSHAGKRGTSRPPSARNSRSISEGPAAQVGSPLIHITSLFTAVVFEMSGRICTASMTSIEKRTLNGDT